MWTPQNKKKYHDLRKKLNIGNVYGSNTYLGIKNQSKINQSLDCFINIWYHLNFSENSGVLRVFV